MPLKAFYLSDEGIPVVIGMLVYPFAHDRIPDRYPLFQHGVHIGNLPNADTPGASLADCVAQRCSMLSISVSWMGLAAKLFISRV